MSAKKLSVGIPVKYAGKRLDQALAALFPEFSRSRLQQWMRDGCIRLDNDVPKNSDRVAGGEAVEIEVPETPTSSWEAQPIPLNIVYEDEQLLVINKSAGVVVHPGPGNRNSTLLNAILYHAPELGAVARAGIVHRLDKNTSGLLVVAKTEPARLHLIEQLQTRRLKREYLALVNGVVIAGGEVDAPIGRHPRQRTRMSVNQRGKEAISHYRVKNKYRAHTLVRVRLESGRTHQIRVHMTHLGYPIVGDQVYGGRLRIPPTSDERMVGALRGFRRQALHAASLGLEHPASSEVMEWTSPLPDDMRDLIKVLQEDARQHEK